MRNRAILALIGLLWVGCGEEKEKACTVGTSIGCLDGTVCEFQVGEPTCVAGLVVEGKVADGAGEGISGATVVALDDHGAAVSQGISVGDGSYFVPISWPRDATGKPLGAPVVTLRVAAAGYQAFPLAPRVALPVDLGTAVLDEVGTRWRVANAATDVLLLPIGGDTQSLATLVGRVVSDEPSGVLVAAIQGDLAVSTAISGPDGSFRLFNVPQGATVVEAYRAGTRFVPATVEVAGALVSDVVVASGEGGLTTVKGSIQMVNAGGAFETSVVLVPLPLFDPTTVRGESPYGLAASQVTGEFVIEGVPPGKWVALAAFEDDGLVRDPDTSIAGTDVVTFETTEVGGNLTIVSSFKITGAIPVVSPGGNGLGVVSSTPIALVWGDDSSEKGYDLTVYDALGNVVTQKSDLPPVTGGGGDSDPEFIWEPEKLEPGMIYQFRVRSWRGDSWSKTYISQTEDLRGAFLYQPEEGL